MIGNNTDRNVRIIRLMVRYARNLTDLAAQRLHRVHIKDRIHILHYYCKTLKPHPGINIFLFQFGIIAFSVIVKLGKHIIPNFHIAVTFTPNRTVRLPTAVFLASVIINFGTGAAGARTMLPEIIRLAKPENPLRGNADLLIPDLKSLLILFIDGRIKPVLRKSHNFCQKLPAPCDGFLLEIISKRKVPQHLKKGTMARRFTYIFQIPCPNTLLAGCHPSSRRNLLPGKIRL